jgi:phosphatidylinositol dimannoside acyltransferase
MARLDRDYLLYRGGAVLFRALPRRVALGLGELGGRLAASISPGAFAVVRANLTRVVGGQGRRLDALTQEAFREYGRYWALTARLSPKERARFAKFIRVEGLEHFLEGKRQPVIFALPHLGAWEVGGAWAVAQGLSLTTVAEPARTARLARFFTKVRAGIGLKIVPLGPRTGADLLQVLNSGGSVALVCDRDLAGDGLPVPLFGALTTIPAGPAMLALRSGALLVPTGTYLEADGGVRIVFLPPLDTSRSGRLRADVTRVTAELALAFEMLISRAPAQWHVFQPFWPDEAGAAG